MTQGLQKPDWLAYFYSHIPCEMWHMYWKEKRKGENFYSHIPCGMWRSSVVSVTFSYLFLLTHPVWDVTPTLHKQISDLLYFYSHIPCGMWHLFLVQYLSLSIFLLTHPVWDVTSTPPFFCRLLVQFLLTHPVWDVTLLKGGGNGMNINFYSHIPCGMWLQILLHQLFLWKFLLTHPVWDVTSRVTTNVFIISFLLTHPVWDVTGCRKG